MLRFTDEAGGIRFGSSTPAGIAIGATKVWPPAPDLTLSHTATITVGNARTPLIGWWDNNQGSITNPTYTLPDGTTGNIRQFMMGVGVDLVRFLIQGNRNADQFPAEIRATLGSNTIVLRPPDPRTTSRFGQGTGMDYVLQSGTLTDVFVNGMDVTCLLYTSPSPRDS